MAKLTSVTIKVSFIPKRVTVTAVNEADDQEYTYAGQAFKRLREILDKVSAAFEDPDAESFEQNISTDGSRKLQPGP